MRSIVWWTSAKLQKNRYQLAVYVPFSSPHQNKDLSYSELDLHKPKRFATLSFGLKRKKKKYDDNISKSTFGLHVQEPDESSASTVSSCPPVSTHLYLLTAVILYDTILHLR